MRDERLDALLNAHRVAPPSAMLRQRVIDAAPRARRIARAAMAWWTSGLAAAGVAGIVAGATLSMRTNDAVTQMVLAEAEPLDDVALYGEPL